MKAILKSVQIFLILVITACVGALGYLLVVEPYLLKKNIENLKEEYFSQEDDLEDENIIENLANTVNEDIKGWIKIEDTRIDYPVLRKENNNDFYLHHDYKKNPSKHGSIFIDSSCKLGMDSKNIILHGHHMNNGSMFADIVKFKNPDFCKKHQIIDFRDIKGKSKWEVIAVFVVDTSAQNTEIFNYIVPDFESEKKFLDYVSETKKRSVVKIDSEVSADDRLMTLSTCSYETEGSRTVIVAKNLKFSKN